MKVSDYKQHHGISSDHELSNHFRNNLLSGNGGMVAIASCIECDEILGEHYICPVCDPEKLKAARLQTVYKHIAYGYDSKTGKLGVMDE